MILLNLLLKNLINFFMIIKMNNLQEPLEEKAKYVLVVDDELSKAKRAMGVAEKYGFTCDYARTGPEALNMMLNSDHPYKYVITDNSMFPDKTSDLNENLYFFGNIGYDECKNQGIELIKRINKNSKFDDVEVIMHSGGFPNQFKLKNLGATYIGVDLHLLAYIFFSDAKKESIYHTSKKQIKRKKFLGLF